MQLTRKLARGLRVVYRARPLFGACGAIAAIGTVIACGASSTADSGFEGDLGNGVFQYQCVNEEDPSCAAGSTTLASCDASSSASGDRCFPYAIAEGALFGMAFSSSQANVGNPLLFAASDDFVAAYDRGTFKALRAGRVGMYAQSTVDSTVVDYAIVRIAAIASIEIADGTTRLPTAPTATLSGGDTKSYTLIANDVSSHPLAGAVSTYTWATSDSAIVSLVDKAQSGTMHVKAMAPGHATITANAGDKGPSATLDITVTP